MQTVDLEIARRAATVRIACGLARLKWLAAATRFEIALRRHDRALKLAYKYGYDPAQPRVPAGNPEGGWWVRVAGGGRSIGGGRGRFGAGEFPGATYGQQVRHVLSVARMQRAIAQVRQYEPDWKPSTQSLSASEGIEGAIRRADARAQEAETRLDQLRRGIGSGVGTPLNSGSPRTDPGSRSKTFDGEASINEYRALNNMPDLFGRPTWPSDKGTVAVGEIDGKVYYGINSGAPGYSSADRNDANTWRWALANSDESLAQHGNIGSMPNDSFYHAESTILLRAARGNGGSLSGRAFEVYVDRPLCTSCDTVLPWLGLRLGDPMVTFINTGTGVRSIMWGGRWLR